MRALYPGCIVYLSCFVRNFQGLLLLVLRSARMALFDIPSFRIAQFFDSNILDWHHMFLTNHSWKIKETLFLYEQQEYLTSLLFLTYLCLYYVFEVFSKSLFLIHYDLCCLLRINFHDFKITFHWNFWCDLYVFKKYTWNIRVLQIMKGPRNLTTFLTLKVSWITM